MASQIGDIMPKVIALDLGTYAVKASIWKSAGRRFELEGRLEERVSQDGEQTPSISAQLEAVDALIASDSSFEKGGAVVAASWGGENASVHRISLPFTDDAQVKKTLMYAVEDEVPFAMDEMVMGSRVLSKDVQTHMLVAMAPKGEVAAFIQELSSRNLEPRDILVDTEVISCWAGEEPTAVLDVGHSRTLVVVGRGTEMLSSRVIDLGGMHITQAVQKALGCSWAEAEGVKHGELYAGSSAEGVDGLDTGADSVYKQLPKAARTAVDIVIAALISEIRATLIGIEDRLGIEIAEIRVGGGGSKFGVVTEALEADLGVPVYCVVDAEQEPVPPQFLVTEGLAHRLTGQIAMDDIDLRQGELAYRGGVNRLQALVTYGGLMMVVFTLVYVGWFFWQLTTLNGYLSEIELAQQAIYDQSLPGEKIRGPSKAMSLMHGRISEADERARALGTGAEPRTVSLIHDLTKAFPPPDQVTIDVLKLSISTNVMQFDAETTGYAEAARVEEMLKAVEIFSQATKSNEKKSRGKIRFTVQIPLDGTGEEG